VPSVDDLDRPSTVYHRRSPAGDMVSFVYEVSGRPRLLLSQWRSRAQEFEQVLPHGTRVERVLVAGAPGLWIGGRAHAVWYRAVDGSFPQEPFYLAAPTLLWRHGSVLFRLEAAVPREEALRIASSLRVVEGPVPTGLVGARAYKACAAAGAFWPSMTLAVDGRSLWVACKEEGRLLRLDARTGRVMLRVPLPDPPQVIAVAAGLGSIWAVDAEGAVHRLDPRTGRARARVHVGGRLFNVWVGAGAVWTVDDDAGSVVRVSPRTNRVTARLPAGDGPSDVAFAGATAYVVNHRTRGLVRIDVGSGRVEPVATLPGDAPERFELLGGRLWVTGRGTDLLEVDPASGAVLRTIEIGASGVDVVSAGGSLWVPVRTAAADPRGFPTIARVVRVDPRTATVSTAATARGRVDVHGLASHGRTVWLADNTSGKVYRVTR
jgi:streptogramin lyase